MGPAAENGSPAIDAQERPFGNLFLDSLEPAVAARVRPDLERVTLRTRDSLAEAGDGTAFAVFPIGSIVSIVAAFADGATIEITVVGRDGFFGLPLVLGDPLNSHLAEVQSSGPAWRIGGDAFARHVDAEPALRDACLRFAQSTLIATSQFAGCNRLHPMNERFARWLLMAHDRVPGDTLGLTQEYLATMLGVRRAGVSLASSQFERAGYINRSRGLIEILDRAKLLDVACECYAFVNDQLARLMRYDVRKT